MSVEILTWLGQRLAALTPLQRWQAAGRFDPDVMTGPWFILGCVIALLVMIPLLLWVSLRRQRGEQQMNDSRRRPTSDQSQTLSSRRIPVGQTVSLRPHQDSDAREIKAEIVKNSPEALTLRLSSPVTITFGRLWRVCYFIGSTVWGFDTAVQSYDGNLLTLKHSNQGRFMNRRRFLRVPVGYPALIARFAFEYMPPQGLSPDRTVTHGTNSKNSFRLNHTCIPAFVPATVTQVAGPGLSLDSSLEVKRGDRILVIFDPDPETRDQESGAGYRPPKRMIADVAEVRHTQSQENGHSIAVELSEARGSEVSELIRLTNTALIRIQEHKAAGNTETATAPVMEAVNV